MVQWMICSSLDFVGALHLLFHYKLHAYLGSVISNIYSFDFKNITFIKYFFKNQKHLPRIHFVVLNHHP